MWFNFQSPGPATLLADLANDIARRHEESECPRPLILDGIGFSHGCEVLLDATSRLTTARFRNLVLMQSSSFFYSWKLDDLIASGKVEKVRNYHSSIDFMTLLAPLGSGTFGLHGGGDEVNNVHIFRPHHGWFITKGYRSEVRDCVRPSPRMQLPTPGYVSSLTELLRDRGWQYHGRHPEPGDQCPSRHADLP